MKNSELKILPILCCSTCRMGPNFVGFCSESNSGVFICKCYVGKEK